MTAAQPLNLRAIRAIVRRDLSIVRTNRAVLVPLAVLPLVFAVVFPTLGGLIARVDVPDGDLQRLLRTVQGWVFDGLPDGSGVQLAALLLGYLLPPLTLVIPLIVVMVLATDSVAGERERGTLEGLLLAPVSDRDLLVAKLLGALLPAVAINLGCALIYLTITDIAMWPVLGRPLLPHATWLVLVLVVAPSVSAAALALAVFVSARARSVQGAQQIASVTVLPLVFLVVGQFSGLLFLGPWQLVGVAAVLWVVTGGLVWLGSRSLRRDRLGPRLR
ncbi:ABC transporter permease subunit [Actinopolymorpha alba]|uniref:ABC transporter permease subunit n=1 Tax=Actinopolymorpha alba TaxID=533267 RepID=UPI00036F5FE5|nr:ABC transporter permease subunit [Actinopolymorpha alba]